MSRSARWAFLVFVAALAATPAAGARIPERPAQMKLEQRLLYQRQVIRHDNATLRWFVHHPLRISGIATPTRRLRVLRDRQRIMRHAYLQRRWTRRELGETLGALHAKAERIAAARARAEARREAARVSALIGERSAWLCIHRGEASWDYDPHGPNGNGIYYGGLQMDWEFMQTYGPDLLAAKGPAYNWTPEEQMMVAQRAHDQGRGYRPWPKTAAACGLL